MATAEQAEPRMPAPSRELADQWRKLSRSATFVAVLTAPSLFVYLYRQNDWPAWKAAVATAAIVVVFRGLGDLALRRAIPWPSLFGADSQELREEDVVNRRRVWFWRFWLKVGVFFAVVNTTFWLFRGGGWVGSAGFVVHGAGQILSSVAFWMQVVVVFFLFIANFAILFGPLLAMNLTQVRGFEPGDAEWGVRLEDVRGQAEAKEEVRKVVSLWQSGEEFERAGGKRERGLLFLGAPGTGKTMLAKAIATGFNSPFVSIPGSGFAATFIGIDAIVVRFLARKAKRLARKWGGTCIVFIDEIDAVGMRRQTLNPAFGGTRTPDSVHDYLFYGPMGALNPTGDLILETRAWRERLFTERATPAVAPSGLQARLLGAMNFIFPGGMGGMGSLALNQLLVVMDGIDNPPFLRRVLTNRVNTFLDACYVVPRRIGRLSLRLPAPRPRREQIYFIGATNVPIDRLDPALIRPGRMGRHVWFRTPTKQDRLDVFDLYLGKVAHDSELDTPARRDEIARISSGYSPAMIDQVCSLALTIAHHDGREAFAWGDLVEAMTTLEAGTAIGIEPQPDEIRATAIHEAGHAIAAHAFMPNFESTRLSVRMRGASLGHHQAREREERFSRWRSELMAQLVWGLGAMAAEQVFFDQNSSGVGGDLQSVTAQAAYMVGASGMGPEPFAVTPMADESEEQARERLLGRFEKIGLQIMNRTSGGGPFAQDPIASVLADRDKRAAVARILGQAYVKAYNLMRQNREAIERIADELVERRELFGDEVLSLLERTNPRLHEIDYGEEATWPRM